jgi:hypothetical protein
MPTSRVKIHIYHRKKFVVLLKKYKSILAEATIKQKHYREAHLIRNSFGNGS